MGRGGRRRGPPRRRRSRRRASASRRPPPGWSRSPRRRHPPSTRRSRRTAASRAASARSWDAPIQPDEAAEDLHVLRPDRLVRGVLRLQADVVGLVEEALDRRLLPHERDDDLAVGGGLLAADDDVVTLEHARVAHRVAAYAEDELAVLAADRRGYLDVVLDV